MKRPPLRRLFARQFLLVAALPLLIAAAGWAAVVMPQALHELERENQQVSGLVRAQITLALSHRQRRLELATRLLTPPAGDTGIVANDLATAVLQQLLADTPSIEAVYLADGRGTVEAAALRPTTGVRPADVQGLDLSARPYYRRAHAEGRPVWSDTFLSPLSGHVTVALAMPFGARMLVANMSLDGLGEELRRYIAPGGPALIVLDHEGRVIVHPDPNLARWQETLRALPLVREGLAGERTGGQLQIDDQSWVADAAMTEPARWLVIVAQPRSRVYAPLRWLAAVTGVAVLAGLAMASLAALRLGDQVATRYRRFANAAQAMADGTPAAWTDDFGSVEGHLLWERLRALLARLREQEQQASAAQRDLQAVLDAATEVGIVSTDVDGVIRLFNRGAAKLLGWPDNVLIGKAPVTIFHEPQELHARADELSRRLERTVPMSEALTAVARHTGYEVRDWTYIRRDGTRVPVTLAVTAVADEQGQLAGFLYIAIDQTQRQRAQALELERERAEAGSRAKSEFLSRVSHELRTPLNAMLGYAQLLGLEPAEPLSAQQHERVSRIEAAGWHLLKLIDDVLDLSRIEAGQIALATQAVDLCALAQEALRWIEPQAAAVPVQVLPLESAGIGLDSSCWVLADATRLRQVLTNLLDNAVKYNRPGGSVRLRLVATSSEWLTVDVIDTGAGLDLPQQQRLFSPFDRLGRETSTIPGSGLGLVITRHLVEAMGGRIEVVSEPDRGSRFSFHLRRVQPSERATLPTAPTASPSRTPISGDILYVEDNAANATLMAEILALRPKVRLHVCLTLEAARAQLRALQPRLVLADLHLPDGGGLDLLPWMRTEPALASVPLVIVSADATRQQREAGLAAGAEAYLVKPLHVEETLRCIDRLMEASADRDRTGGSTAP